MQSLTLLKAQIGQLQGQLSEQQQHRSDILKGLTIFKVVTVLLYLAFTLQLYIGDIMHLKSLFEAYTSSMVGFGLYLGISILLAIGLAQFKHLFYVHAGRHTTPIIMVLVVVGMGLTAEIFQSSGQQDIKARVSATNSLEYQTLLGQQAVNPTYVDLYATQIIKLEGEIRATEALKARCVKTCSALTAKVARLEGQLAAAKEQQAHTAAQNAANQNQAQLNNAVLLNQAEEKHYNPMVKSLKEFTGVGIGTAVTAIMGLISVIFEICHAYYSRMYTHVTRDIEEKIQQLGQLQVNLIDHGGQPKSETGQPEQPDTTETPNPPSSRADTYSPFGQPAWGTVSAFAPAVGITFRRMAERAATELDQAQHARTKVRNDFTNWVSPLQTANTPPTPNQLADQPQNEISQPEQPNESDRLAQAQAEIARLKAEKLQTAQNIAIEREEAEKARIAQEAERAHQLRLAQEAAERERAALEQAEKARMAQEAAEQRLQQLGKLTEDQVNIATQALRAAITTGEIKELGRGNTGQVLKAVGLPSSSDAIRTLMTFALETLNHEGLVKPNPAFKGKGVPRWVIA